MLPDAAASSAAEVVDDTPLSTEEEADFARCRGVIAKGSEAFLAVGDALVEIKEKRLYRAQYGSFTAFLSVELGMSRRRAYDAIAVTEVNRQVSQDGTPAPANDAVSRELAPLRSEPKEMQEAWSETVAEHGEKPTAQQTRAVVARRRKARPPSRARRGLRRADATDRAIFESVCAQKGEDAARERAREMGCEWPRDLRTPVLAGSLDAASAVRQFLFTWHDDKTPTEDDLLPWLPEEAIDSDDPVMEPESNIARLLDAAKDIFEEIATVDNFALGDGFDAKDARMAVAVRLLRVLDAEHPIVKRWVKRLDRRADEVFAVRAGLLATLEAPNA